MLKPVRVSSSQAAAAAAKKKKEKTLGGETLTQGGKLMEDGGSGQDAFDHILRGLCRGLSKASPAAVMVQTPQNLQVYQ